MNWDRYQNKLDYPKRPSRPVKPCLSTNSPSSEEVSKYIEGLQVYKVALKEFEEGPWRNYRIEESKYEEESKRLFNLFKKECLEENGLGSHPKADKVWEVACREGGSGGLSDINVWVSCIAEVLL